MVEQNQGVRTELAELRARLHRIEMSLFRAAVVIACSGLLLGLFLPFLMASEPSADQENTLRLIPAITGLAAAGGGPFRGEAMLASIAVGIFTAATVVTLVALLRLLGQPTARAIKAARIVAIVLLIGCGFAWLLVLALAAHSGGGARPLSPATLSITLGALIGVAAPTLLTPDWKR